ncbi:MAG: galactokinase [Chloroflexi bacterium RBG_16_72_14]|nr:MAG: galactokinase [Chloroflexi bacterium RBG_16_72_14]
MPPHDPAAEARLARHPAALRDALIALDPVAAAHPDDVRVVRAPGRVNLIGEHTDYNAGFVLPVAIDLGISVALVPTDDGRAALTLAATGETGAFDVGRVGERRGSWLDYVAGMAWALGEAARSSEAATGPRGFRGLLASDLPQGAGLSSSAAIEVVAAWALSGGDRPPLDPMDLVHVVQRSENGYIGLNNGIMDQFASIFGEPDRALLLDCRSLEHRSILLPLDEVALVACHSGSPRTLESSAYNERRAQCEAAVAAIAALAPGVTALRDVSPAMLDVVRDRLDPVAARRAAHVVEENARVLDTIAAFEASDLAAVGRLFYASHASLRDLYEVSSPELDALVDIARATPGVIGARLTGAGFGGCTINLVRREAVGAFRTAVLSAYPARTGLTPRVFAVEASAGAARLA